MIARAGGQGGSTAARLALPLAAIAAGFTLSMLVWLALLSRQDEADQRAAQAELDRLVDVAAVNLEERLQALRRVAVRWARHGSHSTEILRMEAEVLRQSFPSMRAVGWVGTDLRVRWVEPLEGNEAVLGLEVNRDPTRADAYARAGERGTAFSAPLDFVQGGSGILAIAAIPSDPVEGFVYAALDIAMLLDRELTLAAPQETVRISAGGAAIYALGDLETGIMVAREFELGGVPWRLTATVEREARLLPHLVLILGLGLSSSLGLVLHRQAAAAGAARAAQASAAAFEASETRFRTLFETVPVGAVVLRADDQRVVACNGRFARMLEVSREEALTLQPHEWDVALSRDEVAAIVGAVLQDGGANEFETRWRSRSGRILDVQVTSEVIRMDGAYIYCACTDISARKSAEQAAAEAARFLQAVVDGAFDPIFVKDPDGRYILVNARTAEALGLPRDDVIGRTDGDLLPQDLASRVRRDDSALLERRAPHVVEDVIPVQGGVRTYLTAKTPLLGPEGEVVGLIGVARDISERKETEEEIRRLNAVLEERVAERTRQLAETNDELRAFSYSVAHDLRAPLRGMRGLSQALIEDHAAALDPVAQDYARRIADAAARLDHLIQDLLAYAQLSRQEIALRPVKLAHVVREALRLHREAAAERDVGIDLASLPQTVLGEEGMLIQIVSNLIGNALTFVAPDRRPRVSIRAEGGDGRVRLWVEDNGIGIAPQHQERIFRVFERLHGVAEYPGTGIGLAIVRRGVERLGGAVGVTSAPGEGSRFWIELPEAADGP